MTSVCLALLAESQDPSKLPAGTALLLLLFAGGIGAASLLGAFLPSSILMNYAEQIGTKNPLVARILCIVAAVILLPVGLLAALSLAGIDL
jgi:hypothetical protein